MQETHSMEFSVFQGSQEWSRFFSKKTWFWCQKSQVSYFSGGLRFGDSRLSRPSRPASWSQENVQSLDKEDMAMWKVPPVPWFLGGEAWSSAAHSRKVVLCSGRTSVFLWGILKSSAECKLIWSFSGDAKYWSHKETEASLAGEMQAVFSCPILGLQSYIRSISMNIT